jgi:hypothetical protein
MTEYQPGEPIRFTLLEVEAAKALLDLRGEWRVHPAVRQVAGLQYERQLFRALGRYDASVSVQRRPSHGARTQASYLLNDGDRQVIVEARTIREPLDKVGIRAAEERLRAARAADHRPVSLVVVARNGFARRARPAEPGVRLVTWQHPDDDSQLHEAVRAAFEAAAAGDTRSSA